MYGYSQNIMMLNFRLESSPEPWGDLNLFGFVRLGCPQYVEQPEGAEVDHLKMFELLKQQVRISKI